MTDPYALSPDREHEPDLPGQRDPRSVFRDADTGQWVGPFVMASYNTRVVRRSNALLGHAYGRRFRYRELSAYGRGGRGRRRATAATLALGAAFAAMGQRRLRPVLDRLLPSPGEGPSRAGAPVRLVLDGGADHHRDAARATSRRWLPRATPGMPRRP